MGSGSLSGIPFETGFLNNRNKEIQEDALKKRQKQITFAIGCLSLITIACEVTFFPAERSPDKLTGSEIAMTQPGAAVDIGGADL